MRRLAAKQQAGSTSGALRQITYKCRARVLRRPPARAEAAWPPPCQSRDPRPRHTLDPAPGRGESASPRPFGHLLVRGAGMAQPCMARFQPAPLTKQPPLSCCTPCLSFPVGMGCTPMVGMPGWAKLPVGCRGLPWSSWAGRVPHLCHWQPARCKHVFTPSGCSPGAGCAACVEPGVPLPSPAGTPYASMPGTLCPCALHQKHCPPTDALGLRFEGWEADMITQEH